MPTIKTGYPRIKPANSIIKGKKALQTEIPLSFISNSFEIFSISSLEIEIPSFFCILFNLNNAQAKTQRETSVPITFMSPKPIFVTAMTATCVGCVKPP